MYSSEYNVDQLPMSCWECQIMACRLPYSKVIKDKRLMEYSYKCHPDCPLKAVEQAKEG